MLLLLAQSKVQQNQEQHFRNMSELVLLVSVGMRNSLVSTKRKHDAVYSVSSLSLKSKVEMITFILFIQIHIIFIH